MKKAIPAFIALILSLAAFSQQMQVKKQNLTTFRTDKKLVTKVLAQHSSELAKQHPEYGILPFNAQCSQCVELIDERTLTSRQFINPDYAGQTYSQQSYFPLHYKKSPTDIWRTIDFRLHADANHPNVYVADNQPAPTKCDLNKKTTTINESGFEFEYNKNLSLFFFEENSVYTKAEAADYSTYTVGEEGLRVHNIWDGINMEQQFSAGKVKTNFVINAPLQLPIRKGWMVIEDHFTLPAGYTFEESKGGSHTENGYYKGDYEVRNAKGEKQIRYEKPIYIDAKAFGMHGFYKLLRQGNDYTLQTLVPIDWLMSKDNTYPIIIDPIVSAMSEMGNFTATGLSSAQMGFTDRNIGSCDFQLLPVRTPGKSRITNTYVDLEYTLTYDNQCGNPFLPPPFCTFSQVTMEVVNLQCNTTTGLLSCNPADPPFTGTCTSDSNLVPWAGTLVYGPNYLNCINPQCPDYALDFVLKNRDSTCGDVCGFLCARGNYFQVTVEACQVEGTITSPNDTICDGQPATFTAHPTCGVPPYYYSWTTDGGSTWDTIYGTTDLVVYPSQDIFVSCIIYDACDLFWPTNDLSVTVLQTPSADAGPDVSFCSGGGAAPLGGSPTTTDPNAGIFWTGENGTVTSWLNDRNIPNPVATLPNGTIDTVFYVLRTSNPACFRLDTVYVFSSPPPSADAGPDATICAGGIVNLGGNPTTNAAGVQWTSENTTMENWLNNSTAANPQATVPVGTVDTFYYVVTATTASCSKTDTAIVFSNPSPIADAGADKNLCEGGTVTLGGNPTSSGGSILWSGEDATVESWLSSNSAASPQATLPSGTTGTFFFVARAFDTLCFRTDTVNVISNPNPVAVIDTSGSTRICSNQSVNISVVGNYSSYLWNNGNTSSSINANQAGQYFAVVTDANGCKDTSNIIAVVTIPIPTVQVFPDTLITYGDSVTLYTDINLSAASIDSFSWYPTVNISCINCNNPVVTPQAAAQYYGVNIYAGGCTASDSALIRVIFPNNFFIPNAFTPNGDGNNDGFYIQAESGVKVLLFQVFNRLGEKIHEGSYPWDGNYKGKSSPPGVYVYIFKLGLFGDEQSIFRKGSVTLIR